MIRIYFAGEWSCQPRDNSMLPRVPAAGIVLHHAEGRNREPGLTRRDEEQVAFRVARRVQTAALRSGRRDSGHHFLVSRGGLVLEGRQGSVNACGKGDVILGAHAGEEEADCSRWGILCEGDCSSDPMPEAQWRMLVQLCARLLFLAHVQTREIRPHSEYQCVECPGAWLVERLPLLRSEVHVVKMELLKLALWETTRPHGEGGTASR